MKALGMNRVREEDETQGTRQQLRLKYKSALDKATIINNFEKRGWIKANTDDEWHIFWALPHTVTHLF